MKRKTAIKKLMCHGMSRNKANKRLISAHSLGLSNRGAVFFSHLMMQEQIPNSVPYEIDKAYDVTNYVNLIFSKRHMRR